MATSRISTTLANVPLFRALPERERERVEAQLSEVRLARGQVLFREGDPGEWIYVVREGRIHLQCAQAGVRGAETICMLLPLEMFCCLPGLDGGRYTATAVAREPSVVLRMSTVTFRRLLREQPGFAAEVLRNFASRLREVGCSGCRRTRGVSARMAEAVLKAAGKLGDEVPLTRREFAELAGTTVETSIRILRDLERAGWVELGRGRLRVLDREALERRSRGKGSSATGRSIGGRGMQGPDDADPG